MDTQHEEMMERRQAGDRADTLEVEINYLTEQMNNGECDGCHPGYNICAAHSKILRELEAKELELKNLDSFYNGND